MRRVWPASNVFSSSETASPLNKENPSTRGSPTPLPHSQPRRAVPTHRRHGRAAPGLAAPAASGRDGTEGLIRPLSDNQNPHKVSLFFSHLLPRCILFSIITMTIFEQDKRRCPGQSDSGLPERRLLGNPAAFPRRPGAREPRAAVLGWAGKCSPESDWETWEGGKKKKETLKKHNRWDVPRLIPFYFLHPHKRK